MKFMSRAVLLMLVAMSSCLAQSPKDSSSDQSTSDDPRYDPTAFSSEQAANAEVDRISKLKPAKSPNHNETNRTEAATTIDKYQAVSERLRDLKDISADQLEKDTAIAIEEDFSALARDVNPCKRDEVNNLTGRIMGSYNHPNDLLEDVRASQKHIKKDPDMWSDVHQKPEEFCANFDSQKKLDVLHIRVKQDIAAIVQEFRQAQISAKAMILLIPKVTEEWRRYQKRLDAAEEASATTAGIVADQLWVIIAVFCAFAILIFLAVRAFEEDIQFELVASGQVIQFAAVIVILVVICILGMAGKVSENTMGTLLGGVGGYVLSQGVGRAAGRQAGEAVRGNRGRGSLSPSPPGGNQDRHPSVETTGSGSVERR